MVLKTLLACVMLCLKSTLLDLIIFFFVVAVFSSIPDVDLSSICFLTSIKNMLVLRVRGGSSAVTGIRNCLLSVLLNGSCLNRDVPGREYCSPKSCPLHMETPENWALLEQWMKNSFSLTLLWFPLNFLGSQGQRPQHSNLLTVGVMRDLLPCQSRTLSLVLPVKTMNSRSDFGQHGKGQGSLLLGDFLAVHFPFVFSWHPLFSVLGFAHWANCDTDVHVK